MTNEEKIKSLSGIDLMKKIREIGFNPIYKYIDWETWLKSEDEHFPIMGKVGQHRGNKCYVQAEVEVYGEPYYLIVEGLLTFKVPKHQVKILE